MSPRSKLGLALGLLPLAACIHGQGLPGEIRARSLGKPGLVLSRALTGVQDLGYTVTSVKADALRFQAIHGGSTFASLFGSDSNCKIEVSSAPADIPGTSEVVITWQARNAGSLAGCRKDAERILRTATGKERLAAPKAPPPNVDPRKVLTGGTYGN